MKPLLSAPPPRFYSEAPLASGADVVLSPRAARHVLVLRLRAGDALTLFDGNGGEYDCRLEWASKDGVRARVLGWRAAERESPVSIVLAQGLSSGDRMDYALQKATELGIHRFQPLATERSVVRLSEERADRRLAHWRNIVASACEQCGRNRLTEVMPVATLGAFFQDLDSAGQRLLLTPAGELRLRDLSPSASVLLLAGPEGGLSEEEEARARRAGFSAVRVGPRVLRTETAPLAAIAALQVMWGDA